MSPHTVLLVCPEAELRQALSSKLSLMPVDLHAVSSFEQALASFAEKNPRIAVVADGLGVERTTELCETLRRAHRREPFQIILVVREVDENILERYLNGHVDDFHLADSSERGLRLRVQAAIRRITAHEEVAQEREFYRRAARQEEELTSRVLDETLALRDQAVTGAATRVNSATGLLSESAMVDELDREVERAVRSLNSLTGFVVSIDSREALLRTHGSDAVSRLLGRIGRAFEHGLRRYDLAGHHGAETILAALPGTDLSTGRAVAERFRDALARLVSELPGLSGSVTFSFGVAVFSGSESREQWLARATSALARAQALGGNRVESDERPVNAYTLWKAARRSQSAEASAPPIDHYI